MGATISGKESRYSDVLLPKLESPPCKGQKVSFLEHESTILEFGQRGPFTLFEHQDKIKTRITLALSDVV